MPVYFSGPQVEDMFPVPVTFGKILTSALGSWLIERIPLDVFTSWWSGLVVDTPPG